MYNIFLVVHIIVCFGLIGLILIQRGRSGGLVEALGGVESIFGTKTNSFFVKMTVILVCLFFFTSIFLAYLSKEQGKSLMQKYEKKDKTEGSLNGLDTPKTQELPISSEEENVQDGLPQE